jgi:hypothetical protein
MNGVSLYRINPKGEIGRWRCMAHKPDNGDTEILTIVADLECQLGATTSDAAKGSGGHE